MYFQTAEETYPPQKNPLTYEKQKYEPIIQPNDIISVYVSSLSPEASVIFNTTVSSMATDATTGSGNMPTAIGYLVDVNGNIEMPLIGKVKVGGKTTSDATTEIKNLLERFLKNPSVRIYFENYRITLLGEVARPGVYKVPNEKMTLPEAIGMAGDMTAFAMRKKVLVIREEDGKKNFEYLDLTRRDVFNSPYYHMHPNDIVYVEPTKAKASQGDNFYRVAPLVLSSLTLIAVVLSRVIP